MCKPSCCSGNSGSSLGVVAVIAAVVFIALIARPVMHAAEIFLRMVVEIAAITIGAAAGLAIIAVAVVMTLRKSCSQRASGPFLANRSARVVPPTAYIATNEIGSAFETASPAQGTGQLSARRSYLRLVPQSPETVRPSALTNERRWQ